jgi:hypothetical protein
MRGLSLQTITAKVDAKKVEETKLDATEPSDKSLKDNDSKIEKKVN